MPRLDQLSELQRQTALYFPCMEHDDAPWTPWGKDLAQSKLSIVTTAGLHLRGDQPFEGSDPSYRAIPSSASPNDVIQSHAKANCTGDVWRPCLKFVGQIVVSGFLKRDRLNHIAPALIRRHGIQPRLFAVQDANTGRTKDLVSGKGKKIAV